MSSDISLNQIHLLTKIYSVYGDGSKHCLRLNMVNIMVADVLDPYLRSQNICNHDIDYVE